MLKQGITSRNCFFFTYFNVPIYPHCQSVGNTVEVNQRFGFSLTEEGFYLQLGLNINYASQRSQGFPQSLTVEMDKLR